MIVWLLHTWQYTISVNDACQCQTHTLGLQLSHMLEKQKLSASAQKTDRTCDASTIHYSDRSGFLIQAKARQRLHRALAFALAEYGDTVAQGILPFSCTAVDLALPLNEHRFVIRPTGMLAEHTILPCLTPWAVKVHTPYRYACNLYFQLSCFTQHNTWYKIGFFALAFMLPQSAARHE
jgi:hypothetical protein